MILIRLILIIALMLSAFYANADYSRMKLYQVIEYTDIAFVGKIVNVDMECYTVEIEKLLYGNYTNQTISIVKFANWQDHYRFKDYAVGQREIVFTKKSNYTGNPFEYISIGAGNEGEIEIIGDFAYLLDRISRATKYDVHDFCNAVVDYHNNLDNINSFYNKELEKYYEPFNKSLLDSAKYSNELILQLEIKSDVHKLLIKEKREQFKNKIIYESEYGCKELKFETNIFRELFINFENRIIIQTIGYNIDSVYIISNECECTKKNREFFIKPLRGEKTNLYFMYKYNNKIDTIRSFDYFIEQYREPTVDVEIFEKLKKYPDYPWGHLGVSYGNFTDWSKFFRILSFTLEITTNNKKVSLNSVSSRITYEMIKYLKNGSDNDKYSVCNIKAFNDKGDIIDIKPVSFEFPLKR